MFYLLLVVLSIVSSINSTEAGRYTLSVDLLEIFIMNQTNGCEQPQSTYG